MDFDEFRLMYATTMVRYQMLEHDIKCIYAYMRVGDIDKHFDEIENKTLGYMIRELERLDNSDNDPLISSNDYEFLKEVCDNRNHWAHEVFIEFIYEKNFYKSKAYKKECDRLEKDYYRISRASDILENIRIDYCKNIIR